MCKILNFIESISALVVAIFLGRRVLPKRWISLKIGESIVFRSTNETRQKPLYNKIIPAGQQGDGPEMKRGTYE